MAEKIQGYVGIADGAGAAVVIGQQAVGASLPVALPAAQITALSPAAAITGFATETTLGTRLTEADFDTKTGALTETAPASDTASSGLNGRLQRIAQRITSLIALLPTALDAFGCFKVGHGKTIKTVSGTITADTDVIAAVASKRIKVTAYSIFTVGTNADLVLFNSNGTGGTELWRVILQSVASQVMGCNLAVSAPAFLFATVAGEKLTLDVNQSDALHYSISYYDDDAT